MSTAIATAVNAVPFDVTTIPASPAVTESFNYTYSPFKRSTEEMLKRGIRCIPIPPQTKACKLSDWPELASCDPAQIASWRVSGGLRQNVGAVASPETVAILDIDDKSIMDTLPQPMPRTMTVRSNGGWHFYLRQTDATRELGNVTATEILEATIPAVKDEKGNIEIPAVPAVTRHFFDFQQDRKYVVAPWSIHPSGAMYSLVDDSPIIDCPDWLTQWIKEQQEKWAQQNAEMNAQSSPTIATDSASGNGGKLLMGGKVVWESEPTTPEQLEAWLDLHKETVQAPTQKKATGKKGATYQYIREDRCPWEDEHTKPNGEKDFAISIIVEGPDIGKTGVKCMHSHTKTWADYKSFLIQRTGHNYSMKTGEILSPNFMEPTDKEAPVGDTTYAPSHYVPPVEQTITYPAHVWDGTLYGTFADVCTKDNFIVKEFLIESIKAACGAVMCNRVKSNSDISPRFFVVLIGGSGTGKGTSLKWVNDVFIESHEGAVILPPLLWKLGEGETRPCTNVGCTSALVSSEVGLYNVVKGDPHVFVCAGELLTLLAPTKMDGGTKMMTNLLDLYDYTTLQVGQTKTRPGFKGDVYLSILTGATKDIWEEAFVGAKSDGNGLYNRFTLVASENTLTKAELLTPDTKAIATTLRKKFEELSKRSVIVQLDADAKAMLAEWYGDPAISDLHENVKGRIQVLTIKNCMHMVWLADDSVVDEYDDTQYTGDPLVKKLTVTKSVMARAIELSNYQIAIRQRYAPLEGNNVKALMENKIRRHMKSVGSTTKRILEKKINARRDGLIIFKQALAVLVDDGYIRMRVVRKDSHNESTEITWVGGVE
ncbi:MAG TPA: bifunctional DNA primase/polymerase [Candidatus Saccharimonadia bacterium]|jgi:energy-coupling factor transporter ATP-binding protein EcfA2|nr:bifunctional DNA primase/polymerase [Candidatus Saccharimonadia bacterium]